MVSTSAVVLFGFALTGQTEAAVLFALPETRTIAQGEEVLVDLQINSEDVSINAAQATVSFPSNILELIDVDRANSVFDFWLQEPLISNEDGTLEFISGTTKGISGGSLRVLKMKFLARSSGTAQISMNNAVISAADGRGTNVLSRIEGTSIVVSPEVAAPPPVLEQPEVEVPQPVTRPPVEAVGRPEQPKLRVPLYPDQSRWYNHLGEATVFWEVPEDVIRMATAVDQNPTTSPENIEPLLYNGKSFGQLSEGIWYAHVQFRNNVGWGPEAHYKISIDTTPPVSFEISIDQEVSDNPAPKIFFETFDALSEISHALIYVNSQEPVQTQETSLTLPLQTPGEKYLKVRFFDNAGNSVEDDLNFEVLPLPTPIIDFVSRSVSRDEPAFISGTSLPNVFIDLSFRAKAGEVLKETAKSDDLGRWSWSVKEPLLIDDYEVVATARDERGALSYASLAEKFRVRPGVVLSIGPLDLGYFEVFLLIILAALSGVGFYGWYYFGVKKRREAYAIVVARDVEKMHNLLRENLEKLESNIKNIPKFINPITKDIDPTLESETMEFIKKMKGVLAKIKRYVKREVEELK